MVDLLFLLTTFHRFSDSSSMAWVTVSIPIVVIGGSRSLRKMRELSAQGFVESTGLRARNVMMAGRLYPTRHPCLNLGIPFGGLSSLRGHLGVDAVLEVVLTSASSRAQATAVSSLLVTLQVVSVPRLRSRPPGHSFAASTGRGCSGTLRRHD